MDFGCSINPTNVIHPYRLSSNTTSFEIACALLCQESSDCNIFEYDNETDICTLGKEFSSQQGDSEPIARMTGGFCILKG